MNGDNIVWGTSYGYITDEISDLFSSVWEMLNVVWGV